MITYLKLCALFYLLNGITMLVWPEIWYLNTPGASETGAFNIHFVRDIGIAFAVSGVGLFYAFLQRESPNMPVAWLAIAFLAGHSLLHQIEMFAVQMSIQAMARDFSLIVLPVLIAVFGLVKLNKSDLEGRGISKSNFQT